MDEVDVLLHPLRSEASFFFLWLIIYMRLIIAYESYYTYAALLYIELVQELHV